MAVKLHLEYGINTFADAVCSNYQPLKLTAAYPDPNSQALRDAFARYNAIKSDMIICGNGSDELIDLYLRIQKAKNPAVRIAIAPPTYYQYANYAQRIGIEVITLPSTRQELNPNVIAKNGGDPKDTIIMIDSPSNPAGDITAHQQFESLLTAGYSVFADEAYFEFCNKTVLDLLPLFPTQLVISRSLSKIAAMAGSRVGYLMADTSIIKMFEKQKLLFNVNAEGQNRGVYAMNHIGEFKTCITPMRRAKKVVTEKIERLGTYTLFSSLDMYVIFAHNTISAAALHKSLDQDHNIKTYLFPDFKGSSVIRATMSNDTDMERLVAALAAY